ncbi:MAG: hypothetical protein II710_03785, partial [Clostridia bacterium]|nr:hypothetical protein [Clostridia bacterium]
MKRAGIIIVNVIIMVLILAFVVVYIFLDNKNTRERQTEHFESSTVTLEHVTENYMEGEQRICDVWARYINSEDMTMEEAVDFIRISHVLPKASAHLIFLDTKKGLSTRPHLGSEDSYGVSYSSYDFLNDTSWVTNIGTSINISRAYTNPMNGEQSLAFCNKVMLFVPEEGVKKEALLLRVMPIAELEQKWVFPQSEFEDAVLALIDADGDYIIKGSLFK